MSLQDSPNRRLHTLLGWGVSAVVVGVIAWLVDWGQVLGELAKVRYGMLVPLTLAAAVHFGLRALRWRYLLPGTPPTGLRVLNDALMLGNMANYLLPLRAGEILRPLLLAKDTRHTFSHGLVSVVIERFLDLAAVLAMFALLVAAVPDVPDLAYAAVYGFSGLALAILLFVLASILWPARIHAAVAFCVRPLPERASRALIAFVDPFLDGVRVLHSAVNLARVIVLTALVWASCYLYFLVSLWMFDVQGAAWPALSLVVMVALAVGFPSAPGFIGVFQAGCIVGLGLFGIGEELAVAYSLVTHAHQFLYICGFGLAVILTGKWTLGSLRANATSAGD